ncbi:MAG: uncharacterized protein QOJ64_683 [Acidobacteriota bacterium]|jgi:DsbC/DsbD-like thiol-disulfide interchange protein|nr:uncharacterized protein [Acidobacteriota bacterium]
MNNRKRLAYILVLNILLLTATFYPAPRPGAIQPNIGVNGFFSVDKAQRGRTIQAAVVINIPSGFHINSSKPLSSFLIPTSLKISSAGGLRVGAVSFPRAQVRSFSFSQEPLSVYEGRAVLRFTISVPANAAVGVAQLRARVKYQSCNDEVCFPPATREIAMPISVVETNDPVKRINKYIFR